MAKEPRATRDGAETHEPPAEIRQPPPEETVPVKVRRGAYHLAKVAAAFERISAIDMITRALVDYIPRVLVPKWVTGLAPDLQDIVDRMREISEHARPVDEE